MDKKHFWKFAGGFIAIIAAALVILYASNYFFSKEARDTRKAQEYLEDLKQQYENDTYGGKTPEETLQLFISALEKGDIDLASKYFVLDKQEEWRGKLTEITNKNLLDEMVSDLNKDKTKYPLVEGKDDIFIFEIFNNNNQLAIQISLMRIQNGIWKIDDL